MTTDVLELIRQAARGDPEPPRVEQAKPFAFTRSDTRNANAGIPPYDGDMASPLPGWYPRAGMVEPLKPAVPGLYLWTTIWSVNGLEMSPCYAGERSLATTIGASRDAVRNRLGKLRDVPGLLLEIDLGFDKNTGRHLPWARWATDPKKIAKLTPCILPQLPAIAGWYGLADTWLEKARGTVNQHDQAARSLAVRINEHTTPVRKEAA